MAEAFDLYWEADREPFFANLDYSGIQTPAYLIHMRPLEENLKILKQVREATGCKILLALKSFAAWETFPTIKQYLDGTCASSVNEARLGNELFNDDVHTFAPAYSNQDIQEHLLYSRHIIFNSFALWTKFKPVIEAHNKKSLHKIECGIRINPESPRGALIEQYAPTNKGSRMGVVLSEFIKNEDKLDGLSIIHFHTLCEEGVEALETTLVDVEKKFGKYLSKMHAVNFGGGHHITRNDYDVEKLCHLINTFKKKYGVQVILEPGEAIALNAGVLVSTVLDVIENNGQIAIVDTTAEAHMPDVLAMPYSPAIIGAGKPGEKKYNYKIGGLTCLSGDFIGDYSFDEPLQPGSKIILQNMAIYTMVKNTTFNGVHLPDIIIMDPSNKIIHKKSFGYPDYKNKLS